MRLRDGFLAVAAVFAVGAGFVLYRQAEDRRLHGSLLEARREISEGRYSPALERLAELQRLRPRWPGVAYAIGLAEKGRGKPNLAEAAWREVPVESELGATAAIERSRIAMAEGRFSKAEALLRGALDHGTEPKADARRALILLLRFEGRNEEIRRLHAESLDDPATSLYQGFETLQELWKIDHDPFPSEAVEQYLNEVGGNDPDDGRVRLGLAYLAVLAGNFDEANRLLLRCEAERPRDEGVARGRLDWAIAAQRPEPALVALDRIRGDNAEADSLSAWLAKLAGDVETERQALNNRLKAVPGDLAAIDRLAEIADKSNQLTEAAKLRGLKDERERLQESYKSLLFSEQPVENAKQIAKLGRALGIARKTTFWSRIDGGKADSEPPVRAELIILIRRPAANAGVRDPADPREGSAKMLK